MERLRMSGLPVCIPRAAGSRRQGDRLPELPADVENSDFRGTPPPLLAPQVEGYSIKCWIPRGRGKSRTNAAAARRPGGGEHSWENEPHHPGRVRRGEKRKNRLVLSGVAGCVFWPIAGGIGRRRMVGGKRPATEVAASPGLDRSAAIPKPDGPPAVAAQRRLGARRSGTSGAQVPISDRRWMKFCPLVRNRAVAEARIRAFYPDGKIEAPGMLAVQRGRRDWSPRASSIRFLSSPATRRKKSLAFVDTPEGLKIDWESWAGWSEIPWEKFLAAKPVDGQVFRVILASGGLLQLRIFRRPEMAVLPPRVARQGTRGLWLCRERIRAGPAAPPRRRTSKNVLMMLVAEISRRTPHRDNQVEIERFVCEGWVEEGGRPVIPTTYDKALELNLDPHGLRHLRRDRRRAGDRQLVFPRVRHRRPRGEDDFRL